MMRLSLRKYATRWMLNVIYEPPEDAELGDDLLAQVVELIENTGGALDIVGSTPEGFAVMSKWPVPEMMEHAKEAIRRILVPFVGHVQTRERPLGGEDGLEVEFEDYEPLIEEE